MSKHATALDRFTERLGEVETVAAGLTSEDLPDALGHLERLKGKLWWRLNALTVVTPTDADRRAEIREVVHLLRSEARPPEPAKGRSGDPLLTIPQAAEALGIRPTTVRSWLLLGKLPRVKLGRAVRIKQSDVRALIESGYEPARRWRQDG
jgi:excisionase family DNA binding protein